MGIDFPYRKINCHDHGAWNRMVECCGVFYFIYMMYRDDETMDIIKVLVWRLDFSRMEWIRVESLSNRAFLIDDRSCTWCWAGSRSSSGSFIEENCIYFAPAGDQRVYSYNLEDDSYTTLLPHSASLQNFYDPKWFMPLNHQTNSLSQWRANGQYPLFMIYKDFNKTYELLDPFENVSRTISANNESAEIISNFDHCKDGWLLLSSGEYLRYLNLFTNETEMYPPCLEMFTRFGFSTCPTSSDCLTVGITGYQNMIISCFDAATGEWEYYETEFNSDTDIQFLHTLKLGPKYHKNAFYSLGRDGCIGELKFVEGEVSWNVHKYPFDEKTSLDSYYLVEHDGELVSVFIGENGTWVEVFKFDTSSKCWLKLDTLGEYTLFVSPASSFSIKTGKSEMRNRIYLPRRKGNEAVFYSLDTAKYHTSSGTNSMDDFYSTKTQSFCCWVNISL